MTRQGAGKSRHGPPREGGERSQTTVEICVAAFAMGRN